MFLGLAVSLHFDHLFFLALQAVQGWTIMTANEILAPLETAEFGSGVKCSK